MITYYIAGQSAEFTMTRLTSVRVESSGVTGNIYIRPLVGREMVISIGLAPLFTQLDDFEEGTVVALKIDGGIGRCGIEVLGLAVEGGGGGVSVPTRIDVTTAGGRAITADDLGNEIAYDNAAIGTFTIPTDAVLGISGVTANSFEVYQKGTGRADIVAGADVILRTYGGYPPSSQYVTQTVTRIGANEWSIK